MRLARGVGGGLALLVCLGLGCRAPGGDSGARVRWSEFRLSTNLEAGPCAAGVPDAAACDGRLDLRSTARALRGLRRANGGRGPGAPLAELVADLVGTGAGGSTRSLERAVEESPGNADLWNDLAVSLAWRSETEGLLGPRFRALDALHQAMEIEPAHRPALFNRGRVLETLGLWEESRTVWRELVGLETDDRWKREAEVRLHRLETMMANETSVPAGEDSPRASPPGLAAESDPPGRSVDRIEGLVTALATDERAWAHFCAGGLEEWQGVGERLRSSVDERSVVEVVAWLGSRCTDRAGREALRVALGLLHEGLRAKRASDSGLAARRLSAAGSALGESASPLAWLARLRHANALIGTNRSESAEALLGALAPELERRRYRVWAAEAYWGLGLVVLRGGRLDEGIDAYRRAVELLATGVSAETTAVLQALLADALAVGGDREGAWRQGVEALLSLRRLPSPKRLFGVCSILADATASAGEWSVSALYRDCVVANVDRSGDLTFRTDAHVWRALTRHRLAGTEAAMEDLGRASELAAGIADPDERSQALADIRLVRGFIFADRDAERARDDLEAAARFYDSSGNRVKLYLARLGVVDLELARGATEGLREELQAVDALYHTLRRETADDMLALTLLGRGSALADRWVRFERDHGGGDLAALAASDRSRRTEGGETAAATVRAMIDSLPPEVAVIVYAWTGGRPTSFVLRRGEAVESHVPPEGTDRVRAERLIQAFDVDRGRPVEGGWAAAARDLHEALVEPHEDRLSGVEHVIVVPDGPLFALPFAALLDARGRPFIAEHSLSIVASLAELEAAMREEPWSVGRLRRAVVFADPALPAGSAAERLPGARDEAAIVRRAFGPVVELVADEQATPSRFLRAFGEYDIVHFAGHGELVAARPLRSFLRLAPEAGSGEDDDATEAAGAGRLYAEDLYRLESPRARLAVLASCDSAGSDHDLPEALALVRPLLQSGVSHVVGSLRPLRDEMARALMERFYEGLAAGLDPAEALRRSQLEQAERAGDGADPDPPEWAYLQHYGYPSPGKEKQ